MLATDLDERISLGQYKGTFGSSGAAKHYRVNAVATQQYPWPFCDSLDPYDYTASLFVHFLQIFCDRANLFDGTRPYLQPFETTLEL